MERRSFTWNILLAIATLLQLQERQLGFAPTEEQGAEVEWGKKIIN